MPTEKNKTLNAGNAGEGEYFEINILNMVKVKSRHVTPGVMKVILIALAFVCVILTLLKIIMHA